jgi:hypothetical protein
MSGGKISAEIAAATDQVAAELRADIGLAINAMMHVLADKLLPLQQDVKQLNERVRNLEQGGAHPRQ